MSFPDHTAAAGRRRIRKNLGSIERFGRFTTRGWLVPLWLVSCVYGCSVDSRTLQGTAAGSGSGGAGASQASGAGGTSTMAGHAGHGGSSGKSTMTADAGAGLGVGDSNAGGAGDVTPTPSGDCPDLDHNDVPDCQETVVKNSTFDADFADWQTEVNISEDWQKSDASENRKSGSLGVENSNAADLDNLSLGGTTQCISLKKTGLYTVLTRIFVPKDQVGSGSGGIGIAFYAADACAGAPMIAVGGTSTMVGITDQWVSTPFETEAPSDALSMAVKLVVLKGFKNPPFKVLFDDVLVKPKDQ